MAEQLSKKNKSTKNNVKLYVNSILSDLNGDMKVELAEKYLTSDVIAVFKDVELKSSIDAFFENNLNISETSRNSFMHRNTLLYRIDKIHKITGLNIRNFTDAVNLLFLSLLYDKTKSIR